MPVILNVHLSVQTAQDPSLPGIWATPCNAPIKSFKGCERVAMMASGGLSHFVIDEDLDQQILSAMELATKKLGAACRRTFSK